MPIYIIILVLFKNGGIRKPVAIVQNQNKSKINVTWANSISSFNTPLFENF